MDVTMVYDVQHIMPFGPLVILYLFLAGLSAGLFLLSVLGEVWKWEPMRPLGVPAGIMALATIIPGGFSLLLDLGQPLRAFHLFFTFQPSSVMSWGSYILLFYSVIVMVYVWLAWRDDSRKEAWGKAGVVVSLALGMYTGVLIAVAPGHPLWNSAVIPGLFLVSGLVAALSLLNVGQILAPGRFPVTPAGEAGFHSLKLVLTGLELLLIAAHLIILGLLGAAGSEVVAHLLSGGRQFSFLGVQIALGTLVPLVLLLLARGSQLTVGVAGFLSLLGVMALRYNIVVAGQELPVQGVLPHLLEGDRTVWIYTVMLLGLALLLNQIIPVLLARICRPLPAAADQ